MYSSIARLEVSKALIMRILVFWLLMLCGRVPDFQCFKGTYCLHLHEQRVHEDSFKMKAVHSFISKMSVRSVIASYNLLGDLLRAGRSGDRIPVGARFSAPIQTGPGAHPASCAMGTKSLS
jgi:hypothetical protein